MVKEKIYYAKLRQTDPRSGIIEPVKKMVVPVSPVSHIAANKPWYVRVQISKNGAV